MRTEGAKFDGGRAWAEAMTLLASRREILLTLTGFFLTLPMLVLLMLRWPRLSGGDATGMAASWDRWTQTNSHWLLLVALIGSFGRLAMLMLIFDRSRPTVGEALGAAARLFVWFYLAGLLAGLIQYGGMLLFVLPGLYLLGRLFVVEPVVAAEGTSNPLRILARSFEITRGNGWRIFAVAAVVGIGAFIFLLAVSTIVGIVAALLQVPGLALFLSAFVCASVFSGIYLLLLLISVSAYRQLAGDQTVRGSVPG